MSPVADPSQPEAPLAGRDAQRFGLRLAIAVLVLVAGGLLLLATWHREVPLGPADLPAGAETQFRWPAGSPVAWKEVYFEAERTFVLPTGEAHDVIVRHRLENLGNGLVRRSDGYYPRNGGAALVHEERYLLFANLVGLTTRVREPAPLFHAVFEDEGWFHTRLHALQLRLPDVQPSHPEWQLQARLRRMRDRFPDGPAAAPESVDRDMNCRRAAAGGKRPVVRCKVRDSDGFERESEYVFVEETNLFFMTSSEEKIGSEPDRSVRGRGLKITVDGRAISL